MPRVPVSRCARACAHVRALCSSFWYLCLCVWLHGCQHLRLCERHIVWHDRRWPSLSVLHPLSVMAWRTLLSWWQRWLTASVSQEDRFVWSVFLYYLDSFPRVFAFSTYICACACLYAFPAWVKLTSMHFLLPLRLRTVTHVDTLLIPPTTELFSLCKTGMIIFNATLLNYLYFVLVQVYILLKYLELWCWSDPESKGWIGNQWPPLIYFIFCHENRK